MTMTRNAYEKEIFRAKKENFQDLLDYKKSLKGSTGIGSLTIRHDYDTDEYVLVCTSKSWASCIMESAAQMASQVVDLENYLKEAEKA